MSGSTRATGCWWTRPGSRTGTDGARRDLWRALGGAPGLAWLATGFRDLLVAAGVGESDLRRLYVDNPARALALRPAVGPA